MEEKGVSISVRVFWTFQERGLLPAGRAQRSVTNGLTGDVDALLVVALDRPVLDRRLEEVEDAEHESLLLDVGHGGR